MTMAQEYGLNGYETIEDWTELSLEQPKVMKPFENESHYLSKVDQYVYEFEVIDVVHFEQVVEECRDFLKKHKASFDHPYDSDVSLSTLNNPVQAVTEIKDGKFADITWIIRADDTHTIVSLYLGETGLFEYPTLSLVINFYKEEIDLTDEITQND